MPDPWRLRLRALPVVMPAYRALRSLFDPDYRAVQSLKRRRAESLYQPWPTTGEERYPPLFDEVARRLAGLERRRILSFGCASGEEVRALRRRLPHAEITGIDINPRAIEQARARDFLSRYLVSERPPDGERFEAVFAMAVFRHGYLETYQMASCRDLLPFRRFEEGLAQIDAALVPGGLLALGNAQFRVADSRLAGSYRVELQLPENPPPQRWLYGPDDALIEGASEDAVLFSKVGLIAA